MRFHRIGMTVAFGCLLLTGCESYRAQPLNPTEVVVSVERYRRLLDKADAPPSDANPEVRSFTFARAAELMRTHSPSLKEARAEYGTALALAKIKTPFPNPSIEAGPRYGFGTDVLTHRFQPFGSIGFSIPTGQRLKRQDELNQLTAEMAYVEILARHRELYLQLRKQYSKLVVAYARLNTRQAIAESANKSLTLTKRMLDAGQATALDVVLFELDNARLASSLLDAKNDLAMAQSELSQLIGIHADLLKPIPDQSIPDLPAVPSLEQMQQVLLENHPDLARLRARYEVAERELRLEIAKQYPDFRFGPAADGDVGDRKITLGLTLGIDIPLFDRNQQAISTTKAKREEIRSKYESSATRALAELDRALLAYGLATEKLKLLKTVILPKAQSGIDLAKKSLEAGATDVLRFLETERSQRAIQLDAIDTELSARSALIDLEQAVGSPLVLFPSEEIQTTPPNPNTPPSEKSDQSDTTSNAKMGEALEGRESAKDDSRMDQK